MTIDACAALVERGDPDRFAAVMAAPLAARERLLPLYAFNLEVARAPWVTAQPLIAEMRLQFWRDVIEGDTPRAHEVAGPFHALMVQAALDKTALLALIDARMWDIGKDPFQDEAAFDAYIEDTSASLMWLAGQALGAGRGAEPALRALGWAQGLVNYLLAVPALEQQGRLPLVDGRPAAIGALAARGLDRLQSARQARASLGPAAPATLAAWQTAPLLRQIARQPQRVADGTVGLSEFSKRARLLWTATTGFF